MAKLPKAQWREKMDFVVFSDNREQRRLLSRVDINPTEITEDELNAIVSFLEALTGKSENNRPLGKPTIVPSGLPVD